MRFVLILACLAWLYVAYTQGQEACRGRVLNVWLTCEGAKNEGNSLMPHCVRNSNPNMWYYDQRRGTCMHMVFHGCGGNTNRYCSLHECRRNCELRI